MSETIPYISVDSTDWVNLNTESGIAVGTAMSISTPSASTGRLVESATKPALDFDGGEIITNYRYSNNVASVLAGSLDIWAIASVEGRPINISVQEV